MSCSNCFDNCNNGITLDICTRYTGADNSTLNIAYGDSLYSVLNNLISAYSTINSPSSILLSTTGACSFFNTLLASASSTLQNIVTALIAGECSINTTLTTLYNEVNTPFSFNTNCLSLSVSDQDTLQTQRDKILQATIDKVCALSTTVSTISANYVSNTNLCTQVSACITASSSVQEYTKMPKYVALPYHGPTSVFDANGKGLSASGYDKVYMCLGQTVNGFTLPDYRGRSAVGVNSGIPTSGIDSVVNPALLPNAGYIITNKGKLGEFTHTSTLAETPAHTHSVTDPGHRHSYSLGIDTTSGNNNNQFAKLDSTSQTRYTAYSTTGITIANAGGNQAHNNVAPSVGCIYIMYIPS